MHRVEERRSGEQRRIANLQGLQLARAKSTQILHLTTLVSCQFVTSSPWQRWPSERNKLEVSRVSWQLGDASDTRTVGVEERRSGKRWRIATAGQRSTWHQIPQIPLYRAEHIITTTTQAIAE